MESLECDYVDENRNQILTNLDKLPNLKSRLDENFINDVLLKRQKAKNQEELDYIPKLKDIKPNSIIWLIKNWYKLLDNFDRGLGHITDESLKKYVNNKIKSDKSHDIYCVIAEIEVYEYLTTKGIKFECLLNKQISSKIPDYKILTNDNNIYIEVTTIDLVKNFDNNNHPSITLKNKLPEEFDQLNSESKNIVIIKYADFFSLNNCLKGYTTRKVVLVTSGNNKHINMVVGYGNSLYEDKYKYTHRKPNTPFTKYDKEIIRQLF